MLDSCYSLILTQDNFNQDDETGNAVTEYLLISDQHYQVFRSPICGINQVTVIALVADGTQYLIHITVCLQGHNINIKSDVGVVFTAFFLRPQLDKICYAGRGYLFLTEGVRWDFAQRQNFI